MKQFVLGFAVGVLTGGGAGYLFTKKYLEYKYQSQAEEEIDAMRKHYNEKKPKAVPVKREYTEVPLTKSQSQQKDYTKFSGSVKPVGTVDLAELEHPHDDGEEGEAVDVNEGVRYLESQGTADRQAAKENGERDRKRPPKLIRAEEYGTNPNYEPTTLYYYTLDDVLATEDEEQIDRDDIYMTVGDALTKYGFIDDANATSIYVRNERLGCDYEITKVDSAYEDCVARR